MKKLAHVLCAVIALGAGACSNDTSEGGLDEAAITARLSDFETSGEFMLINAAPMESQHATERVNIWVSAEGVDTYLGVDPDDSSDTVDGFPMGTMIVKDMLDASGNRNGITVMVKGAEGGVPATADWWWGRYDAAGVLQQGGGIGFCIDCHEDNGLERTDWVYGVRPADRM